MSVVAARVYKDRIEFAADAILVRGATIRSANLNTNTKLFQVNGMTIGASGRAQETALLRNFCANHKPLQDTELAVVDFFGEFADWKYGKTGESGVSNSYLFAVHNELFLIENFYVETRTNFEAIGAGVDFALAALYLEKTPVQAVETACALSIYCSLPVALINHYKGKK